MSERKASMGDKVYRGDVVKFIRNNISLGTFMKRTVKTANEACWGLCDKLNYVPAIEEKNEPQWIPTSERLPEEEGEYLVTSVYQYYSDGRKTYKTTVDRWSRNGAGKEWVATSNDAHVAWMPLPEPYKGVTE